MRTVEWNYRYNHLNLIDQRRLPEEFIILELETYESVANAIQTMVVRGAPAIGATAAFGLALAGFQYSGSEIKHLKSEFQKAEQIIRKSRPTAVNLSWALNLMLEFIASHPATDADGLRQAVLLRAQKLADDDVKINRRMAEVGAALVEDGDTILHHCNTGSLAAVDWGTALGVIRMAHSMGKNIKVFVDETRPRLQGSRLTAWELNQYGIDYEIITDNAAGFFLQNGQVKKVLFGADRVAANGDVANKIGTYMLALAAFDNRVPVYAVVPTSTVDLETSDGDKIPIEERDGSEVLNIQFEGKTVVPEGATARNPAFDITPNRLLTGIITERGVVYPPFLEGLKSVVINGSI